MNFYGAPFWCSTYGENPLASHEIRCPACQTPFCFDGTLSFREECAACAADLHVCVTCRFYDPYMENSCRETEAEYVANKEKRNLCEYYSPADAGEQASDPAADAKAKLAALFGGAAPDQVAKPVSEQASPSPADEARAKLEALFRKKDDDG